VNSNLEKKINGTWTIQEILEAMEVILNGRVK